MYRCALRADKRHQGIMIGAFAFAMLILSCMLLQGLLGSARTGPHCRLCSHTHVYMWEHTHAYMWQHTHAYRWEHTHAYRWEMGAHSCIQVGALCAAATSISTSTSVPCRKVQTGQQMYIQYYSPSKFGCWHFEIWRKCLWVCLRLAAHLTGGVLTCSLPYLPQLEDEAKT